MLKMKTGQHLNLTHWMSSKKKLFADYEGFYNKYIKGRKFDNTEEKAFLYGYIEMEKYIFFTEEDINRFVKNTCSIIEKEFHNKNAW